MKGSSEFESLWHQSPILWSARGWSWLVINDLKYYSVPLKGINERIYLSHYCPSGRSVNCSMMELLHSEGVRTIIIIYSCKTRLFVSLIISNEGSETRTSINPETRVAVLLQNVRKTSLICMYIWIPKAVIILQIPPLVFLDTVRYIEEKSTVLVGQKYNVTFK